MDNTLPLTMVMFQWKKTDEGYEQARSPDAASVQLFSHCQSKPLRPESLAPAQAPVPRWSLYQLSHQGSRITGPQVTSGLPVINGHFRR
ncbi:uncharacterized protein LOC132657582 isoform X3 [Ovis aries]|uniref:uncharacterized protein LOC132657582 isoform X3 n=1 Tax=Ovis aries TaxID=9940 RepID=UPI0029529126|nr:uncharacterized protein LOC132657582 isoform X3 [Ovis aries]